MKCKYANTVNASADNVYLGIYIYTQYTICTILYKLYAYWFGMT